ncbi:MAG TPA: choice-of-anchor Q domain-containing protein, partial [Planctomycetota bacterium]|nr:choice-of-anchor Q domain-containing protein [Planctomycetota bacterium]
NIADGHFLGVNGNISAPALFVDPAAHDYRLRFDSPGIDAGNPSTPAGTLDFLGTPRSIDGDLDTHERSDIGAFEFAPLFKQSSNRIGTPLKLECWGPAGATARIQFSRRPLVTSPLSTPFGEFDLDPQNLGPFAISTVGQSAPMLFEKLIPADPALIGHTFSFQARTSSASAPFGAAFTNGVEMTVLP